MPNTLASEREYRIVDGIYRLHRDLFEIENLLVRTTSLQLRATRITNNSRMGALVAGLLCIVPILISLGDIKWGSTPALVVYSLAGAVVLLWIYQIASAGYVEKDLTRLEGYTSPDALEDRIDFVLEEANAWVVRHRLVAAIQRDLRAAVLEVDSEEARLDLGEKAKRYGEILEDCEQYIQDLIEASARLVEAGKRSPDDHKELLDWVAVISRFAGGGGQGESSSTPSEEDRVPRAACGGEKLEFYDYAK